MDHLGRRAFSSFEEWLDYWTLERPEFAVVSKRCRICRSPARVDIDILAVVGRDHGYIAGFFNAFLDKPAWLTANKVSVHARRHISLADEHVISNLGRAVDIARVLGLLDPPAAAARIADKRVEALQRIVDAAMTSMEAGIFVAGPKDLLKAVQILHTMDTSELEHVRKDFTRYTLAVSKLVSTKNLAAIEHAYMRELNRPSDRLLEP